MITGDCVCLGALGKEDLPLFVEWRNDPAVRCNLQFDSPLSIHQEEKWFSETLTHHVDEHPPTIEIQTEQGW